MLVVIAVVSLAPLLLTLQDMKRPFKPMKDLDMDEVIADIIAKLK